MSLWYTASRYCRGDGTAGCSVPAALGCWCERGTKARAGHLWLDAWHLSHMLDVLPWVQRAARAGERRHRVGKGKLPSPSPENPAGVRIRPVRPVLRVSGWCPSPTGSGGARFPLTPVCSLSCGPEAPGRGCAAARVPEVREQKGNTSRWGAANAESCEKVQASRAGRAQLEKKHVVIETAVSALNFWAPCTSDGWSFPRCANVISVHWSVLNWGSTHIPSLLVPRRQGCFWGKHCR